MTLREAISSVSSVDEEAVIYAFTRDRNLWGPETLCRLIQDEEGGNQVIEREGQPFYYFLEIFVVLEVIEGWREIGRRGEITDDELVRVVIYYVIYDCWPPGIITLGRYFTGDMR